jgi:hypothetical protein
MSLRYCVVPEGMADQELCPAGVCPEGGWVGRGTEEEGAPNAPTAKRPIMPTHRIRVMIVFAVLFMISFF